MKTGRAATETGATEGTTQHDVSMHVILQSLPQRCEPLILHQALQELLSGIKASQLLFRLYANDI